MIFSNRLLIFKKTLSYLCLEFRLYYIFSFVDGQWFNKKKIGYRFSSKFIDNICLQIGDENKVRLSAKGYLHTHSQESNYRVHDLYIATKLQVSGGLTAVLNDILSEGKMRSQALVITGVCGPTNLNEVKSKYFELSRISTYKLPPGGFVKKLTCLQSLIDNLRPRRIWLFNHPQDVVAISGIKNKADYRVIFYHHSDDRLSLAASLKFATHIDSNHENLKICKLRLKSKKIFFLPLCYNPPRKINSARFDNMNFISCTAARDNKFLPEYEFSYAVIVCKLLLKKGGIHFHIGNLSSRMLKSIKCEMRRLGINSNRFVYEEYVDSIYNFLCEKKVNLYLTSFPYGAGRTSVEVMAAGVPILMHCSKLGNLFGGRSILYPSVMIWKNYNDFEKIIDNINSDLLFVQSKAARQHYNNFYTKETFSYRFELIKTSLFANTSTKSNHQIFHRSQKLSFKVLSFKRYGGFRKYFRRVYFLIFIYLGLG
jgi:hypothetical protein